MQICAQVASPLGSATACRRYFQGLAYFRLIFIDMDCSNSRPGSSPKRLPTFRCQVRCCEPGLRCYPTMFGFQCSASLGQQTSGFTEKTLLALAGIWKEIGALDIVMHQQSAERSRLRFSRLRGFPMLASSRLAV